MDECIELRLYQAITHPIFKALKSHCDGETHRWEMVLEYCDHDSSISCEDIPNLLLVFETLCESVTEQV